MEKKTKNQDCLPRNIYCKQCKIDKPKRIVLENYDENKVLDRGSVI